MLFLVLYATPILVLLNNFVIALVSGSKYVNVIHSLFCSMCVLGGFCCEYLLLLNIYFIISFSFFQFV
jgi:hypothetical protein